ncbi:hypothetical protein [Bacillus sp. OK048]|nr:hypothetical protein [Bacillus sp. OK048]
MMKIEKVVTNRAHWSPKLDGKQESGHQWSLLGGFYESIKI